MGSCVQSSRGGQGNGELTLLSATLWQQILAWIPSEHVTVARCGGSLRLGALKWRALRKTVVVRDLNEASQARNQSPNLSQPSTTTLLWYSSLMLSLSQWRGVEELTFTRGTVAACIVHLIQEVVNDPAILPALRVVSLCHARDARAEEVAQAWDLCQSCGLLVDWRCTAAVCEVIETASARATASCGLEGCPAAHASGIQERMAFNPPPLGQLLNLQPACRSAIAEEMQRLSLPPTLCRGVPAEHVAEAMLLSYLVPTVSRRRGNGLSSLPYIFAITDRARHVSEAADYGAELTLQLPNGGHPLLGAAMYGRMRALEVLLERCGPAAVNLPSSRGTTPLMVASMHGRSAAVARLLQAAADPSRRNCEGRNALEVWEQHGSTKSDEGLNLLKLLEKSSSSSNTWKIF